MTIHNTVCVFELFMLSCILLYNYSYAHYTQATWLLINKIHHLEKYLAYIEKKNTQVYSYAIRIWYVVYRQFCSVKEIMVYHQEKITIGNCQSTMSSTFSKERIANWESGCFSNALIELSIILLVASKMSTHFNLNFYPVTCMYCLILLTQYFNVM